MGKIPSGTLFAPENFAFQQFLRRFFLFPVLFSRNFILLEGGISVEVQIKNTIPALHARVENAELFFWQRKAKVFHA